MKSEGFVVSGSGGIWNMEEWERILGEGGLRRVYDAPSRNTRGPSDVRLDWST